jgi:hypothetical protein
MVRRKVERYDIQFNNVKNSVDWRGVNLSASIDLRLRSVPGRMRFIVQPTVATILEARDGVKDARAGSAPFLFGLALIRLGQDFCSAP